MSQHKISVSVIVTVLNEADTLPSLLEALQNQSYQPAEVIIVDGGSTDQTQEILAAAEVQWHVQTGNRSVGRNTAIREATSELIAITDAGCIPDANWLAELVESYTKIKQPVIAGFYKGVPQTPFEQAVVPYVLVMPDQLDAQTFLPATRSMLIEKQAWQAVGGFDETLSDNEDYAFARALQSAGIGIHGCKSAVVAWRPRATLSSFWYMLFRYARGDMRAGIIRVRALLLFARYLLGALAVLALLSNSVALTLLVVTLALALYSCWAVWKNNKYVGSAWYWLPLLQLAADTAVLVGSTAGALQRVSANQHTK